MPVRQAFPVNMIERRKINRILSAVDGPCVFLLLAVGYDGQEEAAPLQMLSHWLAILLSAVYADRLDICQLLQSLILTSIWLSRLRQQAVHGLSLPAGTRS